MTGPQAEGTEKRGVVRPGWTPPAGCRTRVIPGKTLRECRQTAAGEKTAAELDDDLTRRLAQAAEDALTK